jgi:hypothetical protein
MRTVLCPKRPHPCEEKQVEAEAKVEAEPAHPHPLAKTLTAIVSEKLSLVEGGE